MVVGIALRLVQHDEGIVARQRLDSTHASRLHSGLSDAEDRNEERSALAGDRDFDVLIVVDVFARDGWQVNRYFRVDIAVLLSVGQSLCLGLGLIAGGQKYVG